jgi:hypothetical protein
MLSKVNISIIYLFFKLNILLIFYLFAWLWFYSKFKYNNTNWYVKHININTELSYYIIEIQNQLYKVII